MARRREHLTAYLRICISGRQKNHTKNKKNQERIIRHRLKKMFLRVLMRICISVYFLKKSQPKWARGGLFTLSVGWLCAVLGPKGHAYSVFKGYVICHHSEKIY
jgi:hypothetical protein